MIRYTWKTFAREIIAFVVAAIWWIPLYFLIIVSLKPGNEIFTSPTTLPSTVSFEGYDQAWQQASMGRALVNSIIITGGSVLLLVVMGSVTAYVIGRRSDKLGAGLYLLFVLGIILPFQLGIVPMYSALRQIGLLGSYLGMILLHAGVWMPLSVFLYTGFVRTLPRDYEEAAQVDGAGLVRTFRKVVFPLLRPVTGTVAILAGLIIWNDFFLSLIFLTGTNNTPLPVAVYSFVGSVATRWNLVFAAVGISVAPILLFFIFAQKQFIQGFSGGVKS